MLAGLALVLIAAGDAVSTLVTTRRRRARHWPTPTYYRWTWRAWRAVGRRAGPELREEFLGVYGPLSLLGLLVMWVVLLVAGWGAMWWGLRSAVKGVDGYLDAVYFAGVGFFTVGFGDLVPTGGLARLLVLVEAFMGLVTMALVIGYLPTLYGAYSRRELQLLALDDSRTSPPRRSRSWRPASPTGAPRGWRRPSPSGSGGATRCSTPTPPTRCWQCSAPGSPGSTG
ncbi:MAG TPA: ion channel [Actinomycetes bacterium]|nr:ion channel [Actinomycetes bacterium]